MKLFFKLSYRTYKELFPKFLSIFFFNILFYTLLIEKKRKLKKKLNRPNF